MWAPRYLRSSTIWMVASIPFHLFWLNHLFTPRWVAKLKLLEGATLAPMQCSRSCVASKALTKFLAIYLPVPRIRTSSARMLQVIPSKVLMIRIHGRISRATIAIEKGHPCGMPHLLRNGRPIPPARQLYTIRLSK